jgi:two-component system catabolic regulation response regulator CreB
MVIALLQDKLNKLALYYPECKLIINEETCLPMKQNILIIEDESSIADTICYALQTENFSVEWKNLGKDGIAHLKNNSIDLVILDVGLPDINGFEVCKTIRSFSDVPIIFLTARKEELDRVVGLEIGGDDYVVKPFSPRELVARVKVILKRSNSSRVTHNTLFHVDEEKGRISYQETMMDLTRYEYRLLKLLLSQPERIFSREQLMEQVWESPESSMDRTVDAHIKMLRSKLRAIEPINDFIKTHRGLGYSIEL